IAFGGEALTEIGLVIYTDRIPAWPLASAVLRPLSACGVMAAAVLGTRAALPALGVVLAQVILPVEIVVGALVYVAAAFVLAGPTARDFLQLLRKALRRSG